MCVGLLPAVNRMSGGGDSDSLNLFPNHPLSAPRQKVTRASLAAANNNSSAAAATASMNAMIADDRPASAIVVNVASTARNNRSAAGAAVAAASPYVNGSGRSVGDADDEDEEDDDPILTRRTCGQVIGGYLLLIIWFVCAFSAVTMFWLGLWNLLDHYVFAHPAWWNECVWQLVGVLLLVLTANWENVIGRGSNVPASALVGTSANSIITSHSSSRRPLPPSPFEESPSKCYAALLITGLYARATFGLAGIVCWWKGTWGLFDVYISKTSVTRECVYIVIGLILMILTDTILAQGGVNLADYIRTETPAPAPAPVARSKPQSARRRRAAGGGAPNSRSALPPPALVDDADADADAAGISGVDTKTDRAIDRLAAAVHRADEEEEEAASNANAPFGPPPPRANETESDSDDDADAERARFGLLGSEVGWAPTTLTGSTSSQPTGIIDLFVQHQQRKQQKTNSAAAAGPVTPTTAAKKQSKATATAAAAALAARQTRASTARS